MVSRFVSLAGDLDLGEQGEDGRLYYYKNIGNATAPKFEEKSGSANPFYGVVDPYRYGSYCAPCAEISTTAAALRPRPSTVKLRPHVLCRSQATWTSSWAIVMASSTTSRTPGTLRSREFVVLDSHKNSYSYSILAFV